MTGYHLQLSIMSATVTVLMALLILEDVAVSSSVSAFQGHGTRPARSRRVRLPSTATPSQARIVSFSFLSPRAEIMTLYKSKSDKEDSSKSRSWFKPWRWFARKNRRERRKRQPKLSPTMESLLYAFKEAKDLGIIKVNDGGSSNNVDADGNHVPVPQASASYVDSTLIARETIQQIMATVPSDRPIIIENTFVGNTYTHTNQNGLQICPKVKVRNDMAGSFHNNNNAAARHGNVTRQNGVADFREALRNNNNAVSKTGDVSRRNGVFAFGDEGDDEYYDDDYGSDGDLEEEQDDDDDSNSLLQDFESSSSSYKKRETKNRQEGSKPDSSTPLSSRGDDGDDSDAPFLFQLFGKQRDSSTTTLKDKPSKVDGLDVSNLVTAYTRGSLNNATSWYEVFNQNSTNPPVVVRNTYIGNKYETTTDDGLTLGVDVDFQNDMGEAFYENNNAIAYEGNVCRQNGVADFTNALRRNNNAVSGSGDVARDNGADAAALPLLLPLLDFNITFPNGTNATLFDTAVGGIFRLYKRKIKKSMEQKAKLKTGAVDYYKGKRDGKGKWTRLSKASKVSKELF